MSNFSKNDKMSKGKIFFRYGLLILVCLVIFWFSSNNGTDSTSQSSRVVNFLSRIFFPDLEYVDAQRQLAITDMLTVLVRKGAHFTIYTLLGGLSFCAFFQIRKMGLRYFFAVLFTFLYACGDEIHQTFVSDRTGKFSDVIIDTIGGALGSVIVLLIVTFIAARKIIKEYGRSS